MATTMLGSMRPAWEEFAATVADNTILAVVLLTIAWFTLNRTAALVLSWTCTFKHQKNLNNLASCFPSLIHCTTVTFFACEELVSRGWGVYSAPSEAITALSSGNPGGDRQFDMLAPNTPTGITVIIWCCTYMFADTLFLVLYAPNVLFMAHHIATIIYMTSSLALGASDVSVCLCIFIGEMSNPINNFYFISDILNHEGWISGRWTMLGACALSTAFFFIRLLYAPVGLCMVVLETFFHRTGAAAIPLPLRIIWSLLVLGTTYVSATFLQGLVGQIRSGKVTTKSQEESDKKQS